MKQKTQGRELSTLVPAVFVFSESWFLYFVSLILYSKINGFAQQPTFWVMSGVKYGECRMTFICPIRACHSFFMRCLPRYDLSHRGKAGDVCCCGEALFMLYCMQQGCVR